MARQGKPFKLGRSWREIIVRNMAGLKRAERAVLKELIAMGNLRGHCWPSYRTLAAQTGYSIKTIQRAVGALEKRGLIRRRRKIRGDGSQGVYDFAVTLPIPDRPPGQTASCVADTMSSLKENNKNKNKAATCRLRPLEDELLNMFDGVIDWKQTPELLSLHELSVWLLDEKAQSWTSMRKKVLDCAIELRDDFLQSGQQLRSWAQLVERLEAWRCTHVSEPSSSARGDREAHGRFSNLAVLLGISTSEPRLIRLLSGFQLEQTTGTLRLITNSPWSADQLVQDYAGVLRKAALDRGKDIVVMRGNLNVFSTGGR